MLKILHIINNLNAGGKERQLVELLKVLSVRKDIEQHIVILGKDMHYNLDFIQNNRVHIFIRKKQDLTIYFQLLKLFKKIRPDIIHSWQTICSVYSLPLAKLLKIKFVHGAIRNARPIKNETLLNRITQKILFHFSDKIVSNSFAGLNASVAPSVKSVCIHNGFDFSRLESIEHKEQLKKKFSIKADTIIGMVASFTDKKDYISFIKAAVAVIQKQKNTIFVAVGYGKNFECCKKIVQSEFKDKIIFLGRQNNIESIINIFDIGVLSTNTLIHQEGISNSIMEYMALGKPVIATGCGGTSELVKDQKTGFLVESMDSVQLEEKIVYLLQNKKLAEKFGKAGQIRIRNNFSLEEMGNKYLNCYRSLFNEHIVCL